jgi:hypothetical protein
MEKFPCIVSKQVEQDLLHVTLDGCIQGSSLCRHNLQRGVVCTFVKKDQGFNKSDISLAVNLYNLTIN